MPVSKAPVPHLPILRKGTPYKSLDVATAVHYRTREPIAEVSQANLGLIRRDLLDQAGPRAALAKLSYGELVAMSKRAAQLFLEATLPLDPFAGITQTPGDYVRQLSATTGMPHVLVRRNMLKVHGVLAQVDEVLGGLTRGLDLSLLDTGIGMVAGRAISFFPRGDSMGVVLPNNSPGVHSLWAPTTVLKIPLVLKPGSAEPWTPFRMIQAWLAAGCPPEAFSFYPSDHAGGNEILRRTGRGMVFGDVKATERWRKEGGRVEIHGPGFSKVILGADALANWEQHIDTIAASVADNGGRSCVNASGVWVTGKGREIAEALAKKLAAIMPRAADDEAAGLAPFVDPSVAERVSALIDKDLEIQPGVEDVSAKVRGTTRVARWEGSTYLLPTVLLADRAHPLANREYMFPFVSVVEVPEDEMPDCLGHSLVVTAITDNPELIERLVASPLVDRLNIGSLPTTRIGWDQPHEGNLFEHLYARRAIQRVA
ncbi:MAG: aldehyde dehydrogenase family protein [Vicinamibacteria bacterium]